MKNVIKIQADVLIIISKWPVVKYFLIFVCLNPYVNFRVCDEGGDGANVGLSTCVSMAGYLERCLNIIQM